MIDLTESDVLNFVIVSSYENERLRASTLLDTRLYLNKLTPFYTLTWIVIFCSRESLPGSQQS